MSCSRRGCDSIMCRTHITDIGYICKNCVEEFKEHIDYTGRHLTGHNEIKEYLKEFMDSEAGSYNKDDTTVDDFFNENTND